jgi:CheY-like chemotaxis protein
MFSAKRILLVEDDEHDVELILNALAHYQLANEVVVVDDGAEALDYLYRRGRFATRAAGHPILVLLDIKMPKVNGLEVLRQIKTDLQLRVIPVVILSSSREEDDVLISYQQGGNAYVVKPVDFHMFIEVLQGLARFWVLINEPPPGSTQLLDRDHGQ